MEAEKYECNECGVLFDGSRKVYVPLSYCKKCRKKHSKDILELIAEKSFRSFSSSQVVEAEKALSELKADLRLDLHKTLDTIPIDTQLSKDSCCVSYVGPLTSTRISARKDIQARIKSGQLIFGALVFKRGPRKNPEKCNNFTDVGSKAWFNILVQSDDPCFIDDSEDHVLSVESAGIYSIQIFPGQDLIKLVENMNLSYSSSSDEVIFE